MEQPFRFRRGHQRQHAARPGGFAKQRNVGGVAAEGVNILLDPLQGGDLVEQREVIQTLARLFLQCRMGEKAKMAQSVVDRHHHHVAAGQRQAIVRRQAAGADGKPAAVQPNHHRQRLRCAGGGPDVEIETVFAEAAGIPAAKFAAVVNVLPAGGGKGVGLTHAMPAGGRLRRAPAQRPHGRRGVRNAAPDMDPLLCAPGQRALPGFRQRFRRMLHNLLPVRLMPAGY